MKEFLIMMIAIIFVQTVSFISADLSEAYWYSTYIAAFLNGMVGSNLIMWYGRVVKNK